MNVFMKLFVSFTMLFLILGKAAFGAYDVIDRYVLLEDKFKTDEMLRPMGHDFIIPDISVWYNKDLPTLISDASNASKSGTPTEQLTAAVDLLDKYNNTEQTLRIAVNFGIPLFTFHAFDLKIVPDIRVGVNLGVNLKIGSEICTIDTLLGIIDSQGLASAVTSTLTTALSGVTCANVQSLAGGNIVKYAIEQKGVTATTELQALSDSGAISIPNASTVPDLNSLPTLDVYAKGEGKANLIFNFFTEDAISGYLSLGVLGRADITGSITASGIANGAEIVDLGEEMNTTMAFTTDFRVQYKEKESDWKVYAQVDDLKIAVVSDNKATAGELNYKIDPSIRIHGSYLYQFVGFNLEGFGGVHKRERYDFTEGLYAGGDLSFYVWDDRIGIRGRAMLDQEHITLSPMIKLWIAQLDLGIKLPAKSTVDGVKVATLYSGNLRIFF